MDELTPMHEPQRRRNIWRGIFAVAMFTLLLAGCDYKVGDDVHVAVGKSIPLVETIGLQNQNCMLSGAEGVPEGQVTDVWFSQDGSQWLHIKANEAVNVGGRCEGWSPAGAVQRGD